MNFILPNWQIEEPETVEGHLLFRAKYLIPAESCPNCLTEKIRSHGYREKTIVDAPHLEQHVVLAVTYERYKCLDGRCKVNTFDQPLPDVSEDHSITKRLLSYIEKKAGGETFAALAARTGLTENTIKKIFLDHADRQSSKLQPLFNQTEYLGIDEIHFNEEYHCVLTNLGQHRRLLEILTNRKKPAVTSKLSNLGFQPDASRKGVQAVVMDMYKNYRPWVKKNIPKAKIVIDKFHVLNMVDESLHQVRLSVKRKLESIDSMTKKDREIYNKIKDILWTRKAKLDAQDKWYITMFMVPLEELTIAYQLREDFYDIYNSSTKAEAEARYMGWKKSIPADLIVFFSEFIKKVKNWHGEIFNYFEFRPPLTNAYTEGFNRTIRSYIRDGCGYSFPVLRAKLLFGDAAEYAKETKSTRRIMNQHLRNSSMTQSDSFWGFEETQEYYLGASMEKILELIESGRF